MINKETSHIFVLAAMLMNLTTIDIENLDKVIYGLTNHEYDTVPELLNGWQRFPNHNEPNNHIYRFYQRNAGYFCVRGKAKEHNTIKVDIWKKR